MMNEYFGELTFDSGWVTKRSIQLFGKTYEVAVYVLAYKTESDILPIQEEAWTSYSEKESENLMCFETLMKEYSEDAESRFTPPALNFDREGGCALLCDDEKDADDGIAVCIIPEKCVVSQDDYL